MDCSSTLTGAVAREGNCTTWLATRRKSGSAVFCSNYGAALLPSKVGVRVSLPVRVRNPAAAECNNCQLRLWLPLSKPADGWRGRGCVPAAYRQCSACKVTSPQSFIIQMTRFPFQDGTRNGSGGARWLSGNEGRERKNLPTSRDCADRLKPFRPGENPPTE